MKAEKIVTPTERRMPRPVDLGEPLSFTLGYPLHHREKYLADPEGQNPTGLRVVMGFAIPTWQRPIVWDEARQVRFLESAWLGIPLGTYTFNLAHGHPLHNLLIDGQQRMHSIERYVTDQLPIFGKLWSELSESEQRHFDMVAPFPCYRTKTTNEAYLRSYYDLMNFGGVAHTEDQRATGDRITNG